MHMTIDSTIDERYAAEQTNISSVVRELIHWQRLRNHEAARLLGMSAQALGSKLSGTRTWTRRDVLMLAERFDLAQEFFTERDPIEAVHHVYNNPSEKRIGRGLTVLDKPGNSCSPETAGQDTLFLAVAG